MRAFEDVLAKAITHDRAAWNVLITTIDAKLDGHKEKWRKVYMPPSRGTPAGGLIVIPGLGRLLFPPERQR